MRLSFLFLSMITSSPSKITRPLSGVSRKLIQRKNVLLPDPELPIIETTSPLLALRFTPRKTFKLPKLL